MAKNLYWKIECTKHLETLFQTEISTSEMTEEGLKTFIRTFIAKHALSDNEILEQCIRKPFARRKQYININRTNSNVNGVLKIDFNAQVADICVVAYLIAK